MGKFIDWLLSKSNNPRIELHVSPEVTQLTKDLGLINRVTEGEYFTNVIYYSDEYPDRHPLTGRAIWKFKGPTLKLMGDSKGTWIYFDETEWPIKFGSGESSLVEYLQQLKENNASIVS